MRNFHAVGGMQLQVYMLTQTLAELGVRQDVITVCPPWEPKFESWDRVRIHRLGWSFPTPRQMYALPAFRRVVAIARSEFDLVHCHTAQDLAAIPLAVTAARQAYAPLVITLHNSWQFTYESHGIYSRCRHHLGSWIEQTGLCLADAIITLTERTANMIASRSRVSPARIKVIPDGVDINRMRRTPEPESLAAFREKYQLPSAGPRVVYLGRFSREKGISYLIEAVSRLRSLGTRVFLVLSGDGPERSMVERKITEMGISDLTICTGLLHHDDVPLLLASADVVVVPSVFEEFGGVLLEAMAAGLPIIASRVGGIPFVISHSENGLLVDPMNSMQLADALSDVLKDRDFAKRLGARAALDVQAYDLRGLAKSLVDLVYVPLLRAKK